MRRRADLELSPLDRAALNQGRALQRKTRVIRKAWLRLAACCFATSVKRHLELVKEARDVLHKEAERDYYEKHPEKRQRKVKSR